MKDEGSRMDLFDTVYSLFCITLILMAGFWTRSKCVAEQFPAIERELDRVLEVLAAPAQTSEPKCGVFSSLSESCRRAIRPLPSLSSSSRPSSASSIGLQKS